MVNDAFLESLGKAVNTLWSTHVATIDGNDVTVANITIALIIFFLGLRIARKISQFIINKVSSFVELTENARSTLQSISFYFLLIIFTMTSLNVAQIPLSVFAFFGGALAIGFGFGSQNIIKNFISGLILMIEQPIRVGDIISAENNEGRVMRIGARSTHIHTFDSVDILVPNSTLLENNVVNWTLSDKNIRTRVTVGVAYGSPTKKVEALLIEAVEKGENVLKDHPVKVFFKDFGDNALVFDVQFWCKMLRPSDRWSLESDVRHAIAETFEKNGIVIAFPQCDIHLDNKPIEVKLSSK